MVVEMPVMVMVMLVIRDSGVDLLPCDGEDFQGKCGNGGDDEGRVKDGQHGQHLEVTKLDEIVQMVLENVKFA